MACYHPLSCIYPVLPNIDGKRPLLFKPTDDMFVRFDDPVIRNINDKSVIEGYKIKVPCGKCIGCRLDYSRHWAIRSFHEARMHSKNCFVTLTFNDEHLPDDMSVHKSYIQSWLKRFRKKYGDGIRYMCCGEYGEKRQRPHYHILFYGFDFDDKYIWSERRGNLYYRSPSLEDIWREPYSSEGNGFSVIGEVNFETSAYVARYITKKVYGYKSKDFYGDREPEFMLMSRMPGLGNEFFYKYYHDMFNLGYVVMDNHGHKFKAPIPRYYVNLLQTYDFDEYNRYKLDKRKIMLDNLFKDNIDSTRERLDVLEELKKIKLDKLVRIFEMDTFLHNIYYHYLSWRNKIALNSLKSVDFEFKLSIEDARQAILKDDNKYNFIFLDAFTPTKCPCLWTVDFFKLLFEHLEDDGMILTYSNSAQVRNAFLNAGFYVGKIYSDRINKFTGTIAVKNKSLIKHELSEYDLGLIKTKAGIFYRDEDLTLDNEAIIKAHKSEVENSDLISSSKYIKTRLKNP